MEEYPITELMELQSSLPWGQETKPWKKKLIQSPPYSSPQSKKGEESNSSLENEEEWEKSSSKSKKNIVSGCILGDKGSELSFEDIEGSEEVASSDNALIKIPPLPQAQTPLKIKLAHLPIVNQWRYLEMHELFEQDSVIILSTGKPKKGFYLEPNL